jgi:hypothetical protein
MAIIMASLGTIMASMASMALLRTLRQQRRRRERCALRMLVLHATGPAPLLVHEALPRDLVEQS